MFRSTYPKPNNMRFKKHIPKTPGNGNKFLPPWLQSITGNHGDPSQRPLNGVFFRDALCQRFRKRWDLETAKKNTCFMFKDIFLATCLKLNSGWMENWNCHHEYLSVSLSNLLSPFLCLWRIGRSYMTTIKFRPYGHLWLLSNLLSPFLCLWRIGRSYMTTIKLFRPYGHPVKATCHHLDSG